MEQLLEIFSECGHSYEILSHEETIRTASQGAKLLGIEIGQTAPTLILHAGGSYYAVILTGDYGRVDLKKVEARLQQGPVRMASPEEVLEETGYTVGSVALIGHQLPTLIDWGITKYDYIYGGTGVPLSTLKIAPADVIALNNVIGYLGEEAAP